MSGLKNWHIFLKRFRTLTGMSYKKAQKKGSKLYRQGIRSVTEIQDAIITESLNKIKQQKAQMEKIIPPVLKTENAVEKTRRILRDGDVEGAYELVRMRINFSNDDVKHFKKAVRMMTKGDKKPLLRVVTTNSKPQYIPLVDNSWGDIATLLKSRYWTKDIETKGYVTKYKLMGLKSIKIVFFEYTKKYNNKDGKFFRYINTTDIDLTRYQIIRESDDRSILDTHCLIHTLAQHDIKEDVLNQIKLAFPHNNVNFPMSNLKQVADIIKKKIILHKYQNKEDKIVKMLYGKEYDETVQMSLYENHYFIYEETDFSFYSAGHYNDVKDVKNFKNIVKKLKTRYMRSSTPKRVSSIQLINLLFKQGLFDGKHHMLTTFDEYHAKTNDSMDVPLSNIENEQRPYDPTMKENDDTYDIFFADFESLVGGKYHEGFLSGISKYDNDEVKIFEKTRDNPLGWLFDMLKYVCDNSPEGNTPVIYYHNIKYDFSLMLKHMYVIDKCEKGSQIYSVKIMFNKRIIILKDSYKLISTKLSNFPDMFGLDKDLKKQEAIGYTYYTETNYDKQCAKIADYKYHVKKKEHEIFDEAVKSPLFDYDAEKQTFNPLKYYKHYLYYDVKVLKEGMKKFDEKIKELTKDGDKDGLSVFDSLTISSLANKYMKMNGAFDGLYEVQGNLREFLSKAIYGGRVQCLEKTKKKVIEGKIADYDACSLYPSAIHRACKELGLPKGMAKKIEKLNKSVLDTYDYYVVRVKIKKINKKQQLPFIAYRHDNKLDYVNDIPEGKDCIDCVIDKITLEDYIEFQDIEYDLINGVYWNEGTNKRFGEIIEKLYNGRKEEKRLMKEAYKVGDESKASGHNTMQGLIKLMLNSAYGKTIIKKTTEKKLLKAKGDKFNNYVYNHFNTIKSCSEYNQFQMEVIKSGFDDTYNLSHVGGLVLSYSKRIMNEVMNIANDNDIPIYYTDTDSMHMPYGDVCKLERLYEDKYKRVLNGGDMGQFHVDFDLEGAKGEIYATKSIFLGKKCYLDRLESVDKNGNKIHGYHVRMKGITDEGIYDQIGKKDKEGNIKYNNLEELYAGMASGDSVDFILNAGDKAMFEYVNGQVRTRELFKRKVSF